MSPAPSPHGENENHDDVGRWYTALCISSRPQAVGPDVRKGAIVELNRPTASGTSRVYVDDIHGQTVQYSYGLGLLSEGSCTLSNIRRVVPSPS